MEHHGAQREQRLPHSGEVFHPRGFFVPRHRLFYGGKEARHAQLHNALVVWREMIRIVGKTAPAKTLANCGGIFQFHRIGFHHEWAYAAHNPIVSIYIGNRTREERLSSVRARLRLFRAEALAIAKILEILGRVDAGRLIVQFAL